MLTARIARAGLYAALTVGLVLPAATAVSAADPLSIGMQTSSGSRTKLGLGGRVSWGDRPALVVGVTRWPATEDAGLRTAHWETEVGATVNLRARSRAVRPYLGAGMSFVRSTGEETLVSWNVSAAQWRRGVNVLAGMDVRVTRCCIAYGEVRGQVWGIRQVAASGGVRLAIVR